ncbi:acetate--CoA ligase family protein [Candidimonas humi]|uniref:Acetate--CoA ligase family protein n=1 Tax=Candidimonas humi TaxID=683355 RepID=A0ABV8NU00_9BURK|nr:acetate--CoA ligase family protein [Candidimonas humi]MBV6303782.1 acetate--CoA ligase family protein [Candidimonas humi]
MTQAQIDNTTVLQTLVSEARSRGLDSLDEKSGKDLAAAFGLPVPRSRRAAGPDEAAQTCVGLRPPYVVKALSSQSVHKSEMGAVRVNLATPQAVREAAAGILAAWPLAAEGLLGFLVEEMAPGDHEIVIGGYRDPQFGPMVMAGLGGIFVETFSDVAFRVCPIDRQEALRMLSELRAYPVLTGARGGAAADIEAIVGAILAVGGADGMLLQSDGAIQELDINPLIVGANSACAVDVRIVLAPQHRSACGQRREPIDFAPLFSPRTIAVAGVSSTGQGAGNRFIRNLEALGYSGEIYPIHPQAEEIGGRKAYRSFADAPREIDYAYVAAPRPAVPSLLESAAGRVRFAQIMTSGFGEGGRNPAGVEQLRAAMRSGGMRVLGPNCLGVHTPRAGVSFTRSPAGAALAGHTGVISQSGGFGVDLVRYGQARGLHYSSVVTIGNSIDIGPADLLEYFCRDADTRIIGLYLEDVDDGRRFFDVLRRDAGCKPVVILKGGRTAQGQKAAASHTGSLAGNSRVWQAVAAQTGCILVESIEEFIETLLLFQTIDLLPARPAHKVVLFGNGGGAGVVAADCLAEQGLALADFSDETRPRLQALNLPDGASDSNPIDLPANVFDRSEGAVARDILDALRGDPGADLIVCHLNLPVLLSYEGRRTVENIVDACLDYQRSPGRHARLTLVLRSDGTPAVDAARHAQSVRATAASIPVFENFVMMAKALGALVRYENFHHRKSSQHAHGPRREDSPARHEAGGTGPGDRAHPIASA